MKDRIFIDTNVLVYIHLFDEESQDKRKALQNLLHGMIDAELIINVQVINEFYSILLRKNIEDSVIQEKIHSQLEICSASELSLKTIFKAWKLREKYKYSYWDSLILASALENSCSILYSEDMQHGQAIEDNLKIINPFEMGLKLGLD
jgi:predicted nucleic acid-binding protein